MIVTAYKRKRSGSIRGIDVFAFACTQQRKSCRVRNVQGRTSLPSAIGAGGHIYETSREVDRSR